MATDKGDLLIPQNELATERLDARYQGIGTSLQIASDLAELHSAATARTNLGLGTAAVLDSGTGDANLPTVAQADARYLKDGVRLWDAVLHGVVGDAIDLTDISVAAGSSVVDVPGAAFTNADIGKVIAISGVDTASANLTTSNNPIVAVNSPTQVVMTKVAAVASKPGRTVTDGAMTALTQTLTSATAAFVAGEKGKTVTVPGAGEANRRIVAILGAMTSGSAVLSAPYACFPDSMVGQRVSVSGAHAGHDPHYATVLSVAADHLSVTLDSAAGTTVTQSLVQAWDVADLVTVIAAVTNSTTVQLQRHATQTVAGAPVVIGGHFGVYGTNDVTAWNALIAAAGAGDVLFLRRNHRSLLGLSSVTPNKALKFVSDDPATSGFHCGFTSGRLTAGADDVHFERFGFKACVSEVDLFANTTTAHGYKRWTFDRCLFDGLRTKFGKVGSLQGTGVAATSQSDFAGDITLLTCEWKRTLSDGLRFDGIDRAFVLNAYIHDVAQPTTGTNFYGMKVDNGSTGIKIKGGVIEWVGQDGVDTFDAAACDINGLSVRHVAGLGVTGKWSTTQNFTATGRHRWANIEAWNTGSGGVQANIDLCDLVNITAVGCGWANTTTCGVRIGAAFDTNSRSDPTKYGNLANITALGCYGDGILLTGGAKDLNGVNFQAHGNGHDGIAVDGVNITIFGYKARGNLNKGCSVTAASTGIELYGGDTQDANGKANIASGAGVTIDGVGLAVTKTTTYTMLPTDSVVLADATSAGFTVTLPDATAVPPGRRFMVRKIDTTAPNTNNVTIVTVSAQTISGSSQAGMLFSQGDELEVTSDGSNWRVTTILAADIKFTASGSLTVPAGWNLLAAVALAGGGGGGGAGSATTSGGTTTQVGGGGGAAGAVVEQTVAVTPGTVLTVTVGAGGAKGTGGAANNNTGVNGTVGGTSSIIGTGVAVSAAGGAPGRLSAGNSTATAAFGVFGTTNQSSTTFLGNGSGGSATSGTGNVGGIGPGRTGSGGGGGAPANGSNGGGAGASGTPGAQSAGGVNNASGTTAGVDATDASPNTGSGGGGGGGGAPGGKGGDGAKGGSGYCVVGRRG